MSARRRQIATAALVVFAGLLCLLGLTGGELIRNEGLRARLAAEAWYTGNWLVPTLYGEPHLTKPPGMTTAIGLCSVVAGKVTPLTARLPSVLAGLVVVWLVYRTVADRLGVWAGLAAAAILPCSGMWLDRVPSAEIDLVQLAWVTGSLVCLLNAVEGTVWSGVRRCFSAAFVFCLRLWMRRNGNTNAAEQGTAALQSPSRETKAAEKHCRTPDQTSDWPWWLAALACVASGLFTKWTAPAFFYLTAIPFLALQGRLKLLLSPAHLVGAGLVAALALGWLALAGHVAGWPLLVETLGREALLRLSPGHHPRPYPWDELITFPLSFLAANLPWSAFAVPAMVPSFARLWDERTRRLLLLCQLWLWVNLLFWTLAPGHRPRHLLPAQPALAILAALVWIAWLTGRLRWPVARIRPAGALVGLLATWLAVKLVFVATVLPVRQHHRSPRANGELLARTVPAGEVLYLRRLKDEGLMFYYGRPACRLHDGESAPAGAWCLLTDAEWRTGQRAQAQTVRTALHDGQGAPVVLVRLHDGVSDR
jgi:4-amino-4-deoxy-L-arabinose transferase-like glycosyltransferase